MEEQNLNSLLRASVLSCTILFMVIQHEAKPLGLQKKDFQKKIETLIHSFQQRNWKIIK